VIPDLPIIRYSTRPANGDTRISITHGSLKAALVCFVTISRTRKIARRFVNAETHALD
jgi:hypothetical protein